MSGEVWLNERYDNPSTVGMNFEMDDRRVEIVLSRDGVEIIVSLLTEWLDEHKGRMEELCQDLTNG